MMETTNPYTTWETVSSYRVLKDVLQKWYVGSISLMLFQAARTAAHSWIAEPTNRLRSSRLRLQFNDNQITVHVCLSYISEVAALFFQLGVSGYLEPLLTLCLPLQERDDRYGFWLTRELTEVEISMYLFLVSNCAD